jgi:Indolepyruvate ferredoxin oxidoreductase, alpha and beta subunits
MAVVIDQSKCTGCGACVDICPCESLSLQNSLCVVDESSCADCGACVDECPVGALSL